MIKYFQLCILHQFFTRSWVCFFFLTSFQDFGRQDIRDADGDLVPKEDFFFLTLADGRRFAVRGSGTEPKIKFYLFAGAKPENARALSVAKQQLAAALVALRNWLEADARKRAGL